MPADAWVSGFLLLVGLFATIEALKLSIGEASNPGPGFFPFYLGVILSLTSFVLLARSLIVMRARSGISSQESRQPLRRVKVWVTLLAMVGYAFALDSLGFLLATFLLILFLNKVIEPRRWWVAVAASFATTVAAYALFRLLDVRFPDGLWAPW